MSLVHKWAQQFMWLRRSSTLRLAAILSLIFAIGFVIAIFVALSLGQRAIENRMDANLASLAKNALIGDRYEDSPTLILRPLDDLSGLPQRFRRAAERGGGTVQLQRNIMRSDLWRIMIAQDSEGASIMVAVPLDESADVRELLAGILWTTAGIVIFATLAIGLWTGYLAQRRLAKIKTTLGDLASGDLTARIGLQRSNDDLDDIAQNLDKTASEIERLVTQTRHLSASIAHDLRTPLARLQAQLEMLPESEERIAAIIEANRLSTIFNTIMRVARIEAQQGREGFEAIDLAELIGDLAETFGPVVEDAGKALTIDLSKPAQIQADRGMLVQALANLIQNAIVHGGDEITLFAHQKRFGVADNGMGVDADAFEDIVKPMVRLDSARSTEGSGLGLALVRAVADRHAAVLELAENNPQGLKVTLNFTKL